MRRQFEGGYISRAASIALNFQGIDYFEWALFGVYVTEFAKRDPYDKTIFLGLGSPVSPSIQPLHFHLFRFHSCSLV